MKGNIFNIQKFSIHDGPGVRTTIFFKGCPLKCKWCANPESQEPNTQITYDKKKCMQCGACLAACKNDAIYTTNPFAIKFHKDKCIGCLSCVNACTTNALKAEGEMMDVEDVVEKCLQDKMFYEESGGGVTLSGGEALYQPDFAKELITRLKEKGIHVAVETTGYIEQETFHDIAPMFDLLLFDVKHYDSDKHKIGTGLNNELIISNLKWIIENNIEVLPRIPVIPGFNNSLEDAKGFVKLFKNIGVKTVELLPFHQFGERKYELLDREYEYEDIDALHKEDLEQYKQIFVDNNIECILK